MRDYNMYKAKPDIRPVPSHADFGMGRKHFTPGSILSHDLWSKGMVQYGYYGVSKYGHCLYGGANTVTQDILANLFDANTFLYAVSDATPIPKTRAEVLALLSGQAIAAFSWNGQNLTYLGILDAGAGSVEIGTIGAAAGLIITSTQNGGKGVRIQGKQVSDVGETDDNVLSILATGKDDAGAEEHYCLVNFKVQDPTAAHPDGKMAWLLKLAGGWNEAMTLSAAGALWLDAGLTMGGALTLEDAGLVYLEMRAVLDHTRILGNLKPTKVTRGLVQGYSLPLYAADEEIYLEVCVPGRYDGASDIFVHVHCYLDTANTGKNFNLVLEWVHFTPGTDAVPNTDTDVPVETATGTAAQYKSFEVSFTLDYDLFTPDNIAGDDQLHLRLRRQTASENEIAGEVVVTHVGVMFRRDKLGTATP